jgi:hypothetical protein
MSSWRAFWLGFWITLVITSCGCLVGTVCQLQAGEQPVQTPETSVPPLDPPFTVDLKGP